MDAATGQSLSSKCGREQGQHRRLPIGAEPTMPGGTHFRVWAPQRQAVSVVLAGGASETSLNAEGNGYFSGAVADARAGTRYWFRLDGVERLLPDPASRFQPDGPHGPSQVVNPATFPWTDQRWQGTGPAGQVLYEMHVGTFTPEGTWSAAARQLPELADLGITCIEMMPVADFTGQFGWGYDGVNLFAPTRLYGSPDDLRAFIDRAHAVGIGVILDVVYNHLGPDGNYLGEFTPDYFSTRHKTEWGAALNFDGPHSGPVREFFVANARHWIEEYHVDGFRFDATQSVFDESREHVFAEITRCARAAAGQRQIYLVAENEPQHTRIVRPPERGGIGMDALWNDDFHHSATVRLTGHHEAYYTDHPGRPQEFVSAAKWGYLFQGQWYHWQGKRRGTPALDLPPTAFVHFIENHDQLANSAYGRRVHQSTSFGQYKAMTALLLLGPQTPMLFQGQEFAATSPFLYFADHHEGLAKLVRKGRAEFMAQFPSIARPEMQQRLTDPGDAATFARCKLDFAERERHAEAYALHRDLLALRRDDPTLRRRTRGCLDGAVLGADTFVLRLFGEGGDDRLLLVNFGADYRGDPAPEPLLAPPDGMRWDLLWSSEHPTYGGRGTVPPEETGVWRVAGHSAVVMRPAPTAPQPHPGGEP